METISTQADRKNPTAIAQRTAPATFIIVPLAQLREHPLNPRKRFDDVKLAELAASIQEKGILNPLLVRPRANGGTVSYEILAGARRFRASKLAGVADAPVIVREMDDVAALELLVVDNDQREDVHPLEEAAGYQQLMDRGKWDVARLAARIGRSVKYVYDRVKLLALTKDAQRLFMEDRFSAGHAILLARLKPEDQKRAIGELKESKKPGRYGYDQIGAGGGLFTTEHSLDFGDKDPGPWDDVKPVSVRELEHWIDRHVRLEAKEADPMIFPELVDTVQAAEIKDEKVVRITHNEITPDELRDGPKAILGRSWERADGKQGSKTCAHSVIGNVVIGADRGDVFRVCVAKEKCTVHWGDRIRARKKAEAAAAKGGSKKSSTDDYYERQRRKDEEERRRAEAERTRWKKAAPTILEAIAERVKKLPAGATGLLADTILGDMRGAPTASQYIPRGRSAEDLVRHAAFQLLYIEATDEWRGPREFPKIAKAFGVDVKKILDEAAPEPTPEEKAAPAKTRKK